VDRADRHPFRVDLAGLSEVSFVVRVRLPGPIERLTTQGQIVFKIVRMQQVAETEAPAHELLARPSQKRSHRSADAGNPAGSGRLECKDYRHPVERVPGCAIGSLVSSTCGCSQVGVRRLPARCQQSDDIACGLDSHADLGASSATAGLSCKFCLS